MFQKKCLHVGLVTALVVAMLSLLGACTEQEFASQVGNTTLGALAVGVYEVSAGVPCHDGPRPILVEEQDFWGRNETHAETRYVSCDDLPEVKHARDVAEAYQLNERASWLMLKVMKEASKGDMKSLRDAGFQDADLMAVARYEVPNREGMTRISHHFYIDPKVLTRVFKKILKDAKRLSRQKAASANSRRS